MFIAYSDASVSSMGTYLAFVVIFEDKSMLSRKIVVNEPDNNIAEATAFKELLFFLNYYKFYDGLILFDSNGLKAGLKNSGNKFYRCLLKDSKEILNKLQIRTQVIPRKYNIAHKMFGDRGTHLDKKISLINRSIFDSIPDYPKYFMQLSVLSEYRQLFKKPNATFHDAQMNLNKKVWLADLVEEVGDVKQYVVNDKRIKVYKDTIVKLSEMSYVSIGNHWRTVRKSRQLQKVLKRVQGNGKSLYLCKRI